MAGKFYYNPVESSLSIVPGKENTTTWTEKIMTKGFKDKPLTRAEVGKGGYVPKEQRLFEKLKVPGYETPEKSDASFKHYQNMQKDVTGEDWRKDTPRYRKFLADTFAADQQTIFWNENRGKFFDKWGQEKTAVEALTEQRKIDEMYKNIAPDAMKAPEEKKKVKPYKFNKYQKEKMKPTYVSTWDAMKQTAKTPQEIKEIRDTVNRSVRSMKTTEWLSPDERKYVDKDLLEQIEGKPKPLEYDWRLAPWQDYPKDDDAPQTKPVTNLDVLEEVKKRAETARLNEVYDRGLGTLDDKGYLRSVYVPKRI